MLQSELKKKMETARRDMKRGGTKKQSGSTKSKKGVVMLKKLNSSSSYKDHYEFSSHSDLENEEVSKKKKTKLLKKNFKDSNGVVVHASVPRKLRSAMKKRNLESVSKLSSASKRFNTSKTGIESYKIKKENQEMEGKGIVPESISKDEKEVAETLYGLAGMFTETENTCDHLSNEEETTKVDDSVLVSAKTNLIDEMSLEQSEKHRSSTGMVDFIDRLKQSSFVNATDLSSARAMETKVVATSDNDHKTNGLALWPGLSASVQSGSQFLSKPSSAKLPPWMDQAISPIKNASLLSEPLRIQPRKLKKCASHIYISRLIKVLQNGKSTPATLNQTEQRSSEMSERKLPDPVTTISDFKTMVSPPKRFQNPHMLDIHRTQNQKPVHEDITPIALELYNPHTSQKQNNGFLSLSSSGASQSHFQLPNSFPQYPISATYNSHLPPSTSSHQVQQISPYLPSRYQTAYNANQQQHQQLQKRLWAASQYRQTSGNTPQQSSNQYSKPNLSLNLTSIQQPLHVGSSSQRYNNNVSQQQQQQQHRLMAAARSMSMNHHHHNNNPSRTVVNRQEHHFPLIYEETRTPLQLLCNEQS